MIATKSNLLPSETVERVMQEHDALRDKVQRINTVLADPVPDKHEGEKLLREFMTALIVHFSSEEDEEGFFAEVMKWAPRLSGQADQLYVEHRQLLHDAEELCRFASAGSPSMPWWRELQSRTHEFCRRLMKHEHDENKLLQEAHQRDIGTYD
jgi:iron-sulfur cluster repair protein YtfE (RIC family)